MIFNGIAIGGHKGAGKDFLATYILQTRRNIRIVRSKTPIVEAFEQYYHEKYNKAQHDKQLMDFSKHIARARNPHIVADWLRLEIPTICVGGEIPLIPDMRFLDENAAARDCGLLTIKVEADPEVCQARTLAREGTLENYRPDDPTEIEIDLLSYHYEVDNNADDGGKKMLWQFEDIMRRMGAAFARRTMAYDALDAQFVRIIDHLSPFWFDTGYMIGSGVRASGTYALVEMTEDGKTREFPFTDVLAIDEE